MLTAGFTKHLESRLSEASGFPVTIKKVVPLAGGSINQTFCLYTSSGERFLKFNHSDRFPGMFESEVTGLNRLRQANGVRIPEVIGIGESSGFSYLLLEMLVPGKRQKDYWETAGRSLAAVHRIRQQEFGLNDDNYIGSLPQKNRFSDDGSGFLIDCRFDPLVKLAFNNKLLTKVDTLRFESLYKKLPGILPNESPSLLHGDLWNGNIITGPDGYAWFIDPAVYFGYRETDLAMTLLFGGFDEAFYETYHDVLPLPANWEERVSFFQLYPLLVHLNLFGPGYYNQLMAAVKPYT